MQNLGARLEYIEQYYNYYVQYYCCNLLTSLASHTLQSPSMHSSELALQLSKPVSQSSYHKNAHGMATKHTYP